VFDEFMGIPAHPLMVHAAVVFVPLLVVAAVVYAVVPSLRARVGWVASLLAVAAPGAALFAKLSGEELESRLTAQGYPPQTLEQVNRHQSYGDRTFWLSLLLGVATGVLIFVVSRRQRLRTLPAWAPAVLSAVVVALAVLTAIYVFLTGDSGANAVWGTLG
jgi:uncharacterized membrane protein